jgi:hypothetical protein
MWDGFTRVFKSVQGRWDDSETGYIGILNGTLEESLQADTDTKEWLSVGNMLLDGVKITSLGELG